MARKKATEGAQPALMSKSVRESFSPESSENSQELSLETQEGTPFEGLGERDHEALAPASPEFLLA